MDAKTAAAWWGSPLLHPQEADAAEYVVEHTKGRFAPGDGERYVPSSIAVVLGAVRPRARDADQVKVLEGGGIVVRGTRKTKAFALSEELRTVRVRGHVATVHEAKSVSTGKTFRLLIWRVQDNGLILEWNVLDDPRRRSLQELVAVLNALRES